MIRAVITGVGGYVPDYVMTNEELSTMVDTNDEWIMTRTGIKERRILKVGATSTMAIKAIDELLKKTNTKPEEVDLLLLATVTPDMRVPATVNIIQEKMGLINAWGFDYQAGCSGFLFGIEIVQRFVESGRYKKAVLVGSDMMSSITNYKDRNTCILFGDGAAAIMVEPIIDSEYGIIDTQNYCDSAGAIECLNVKRHGSAYPLTADNYALDEHFVYQDGKRVFVRAVKGMADVVEEVMARNQLSKDNLAWLVPHQANKRIIDAARDRAGLTEDKVMLNIHRYGNTTNATIPLCLWEYEKQLKKGDNIMLCAFGAGYTWGSAYVKWGY
ncbi:MAG: ketoacyl-ACP synthase III [Chitinophagales bacterium]|nr:ketoacyl-ACP synthase III [Chitinophagales bacterium]